MVDVGLVTATSYPDLTEDDRGLVRALRQLGLSSAPAVWTDPDYRWDSLRCAVIRSTWDYSRDPDRFLNWLERTGRQTHVENPVPLVRWNSHKRYLRELAEGGVPTVPTRWIARGSAPEPASVFGPGDWSDVVVKPAVSAGGYRTRRFLRTERDEALAHLKLVLSGSEAMVQPYVRSFETEGEHSLVYFDGRFSHAVRRAPGMGRGASEHLADYAPIVPTDRELEVAERALSRLVAPPLYARVDLVASDEGRPWLGELELIEPALYLASDPPRAAEAFARAIARRLDRA